jgi:5-(carboxyamino)imidazole ribonucleotide mutase
MVQMPGGVPVAVMAIGKAGAKNAGLFAAQILSTANPGLLEKLVNYKAMLAEEVAEKDAVLQQRI